MERGFSRLLEIFIFLVSRQFKENNSWLTARARAPPRSFSKKIMGIAYENIKIHVIINMHTK